MIVMKQTATPNEVLMDGKSLSLTGLSDFVANLERSGSFQKSVEIVSSATDASASTPGDLIKFEIKAVFKGPGEYRVRARWRDGTGRCGHWSSPVNVSVR